MPRLQQPPPPVCLSVILCESVRVVHHRKLDILGAINGLTAKELPMPVQGLIVLCSLTQGRGSYRMSVAIDHDESGRRIYHQDTPKPLTMHDPGDVHDAFFVLERATFYAPGRHTIKVYADNREVARRPINIRLGEGM